MKIRSCSRRRMKLRHGREHRLKRVTRRKREDNSFRKKRKRRKSNLEFNRNSNSKQLHLPRDNVGKPWQDRRQKKPNWKDKRKSKLKNRDKPWLLLKRRNKDNSNKPRSSRLKSKELPKWKSSCWRKPNSWCSSNKKLLLPPDKSRSKRRRREKPRLRCRRRWRHKWKRSKWRGN